MVLCYSWYVCLQVLFSVMQNYRPEIPAEEDLPGKPGATLSRYVATAQLCVPETSRILAEFQMCGLCVTEVH